MNNRFRTVVATSLLALACGGTAYAQSSTYVPIVNNKVASRTYVDLGAQFKTGPFTLFGSVNNLFDRDPPITPYTSPNFDVIGRYISGGVKLNF